MTSRAKSIALTIASRTESLSDAREFISSAARDFGFGEEDIANIVLSVDEACTNIIKHAYQYDAAQNIHIEVVHDADKFEIRIVDKGKPFDPDSIKRPDLREHLSQFKRGGLGVYLMKRLMDHVEYRFVPGKNEVRLTKMRSGHTSQTSP